MVTVCDVMGRHGPMGRCGPMARCVPMADGPVVCKKRTVDNSSESKPAGLLSAQKNGKTGPDYLKVVLDVSKDNRHPIIELKKPAGARWKKVPLEDTIYRGEPKVVDEWGEFYLPEKVSMHVEGVVEGISCPSNQLVLMTCEDENLYAYDGEELHLVASSMKQLLEEGIEYPASKRYYEGEAFKDMTEEDWEEVWNSPVARRQDQELRKEVLERNAKCGPLLLW